MPLYGPGTGGSSSGGGFPLSASFVLTQATGSVPGGRVIAAGPGITVTDNGPGSTVVIAGSLTSSFVVPTAMGQVLFAATNAQFVPSLPITTQQGWLLNNAGYMLVSSSL